VLNTPGGKGARCSSWRRSAAAKANWKRVSKREIATKSVSREEGGHDGGVRFEAQRDRRLFQQALQA
jgi:hypothetical protein